MQTNTWQNTAITFPSATVDTVTGQAFNQAYHAYTRDTIATQSFQGYAGATITVSGWVNTSNLTGHPVTGYTWNTNLGVTCYSTLGVQSFLAATTATLAAGTGWTLITGTLVVPANTATIQPWVQIDQLTNSSTYYIQFSNLSFGMSFNGMTVQPMPTTATPMQLDFEQTTAVSVATSPFTQGTQMQVWPGAETWTCNVALPALKKPAPDVWQAWLLSLQGRLNTFQMGDYSHTNVTGTALGNPMVDGTSGGYNLPTSYFLHTKGWTANQSNVLNAGDYIQIGMRLHRVTSTVVADNNGNAVIPIWPSIREQPGDGQDVITSNAQGLWRLAENKCVWTERSNKIVGLAFKVMEAR